MRNIGKTAMPRGALWIAVLPLMAGCYTQLQLSQPAQPEQGYTEESPSASDWAYLKRRSFDRFYRTWTYTFGPPYGYVGWYGIWGYYDPFWWDPWCWEPRSVRITLIFRYPWWRWGYYSYYDPFWRPAYYASPWRYTGLYRYRIPQPADYGPRESGRTPYSDSAPGHTPRTQAVSPAPPLKGMLRSRDAVEGVRTSGVNPILSPAERPKSEPGAHPHPRSAFGAPLAPAARPQRTAVPAETSSREAGRSAPATREISPPRHGSPARMEAPPPQRPLRSELEGVSRPARAPRDGS
ncbi:MAG: hypothetical protein RML47_03425 [Bacteroidota bacterium]|nr:hypothetical protein [Bacteroidota bacterium]